MVVGLLEYVDQKLLFFLESVLHLFDGFWTRSPWMMM